MKSNLEVILDENKFPYKFMKEEERNLYFKIIKNCKDVCDTRHPIAGKSSCSIVEMEFVKDDVAVNTNGSAVIGVIDEKEYRTIDANIYITDESIVVDMLINRLHAKDRNTYRLLDEFTVENGVLIRKSQYNYDMKTIIERINNEDANEIIEFINTQKKKGRKK